MEYRVLRAAAMAICLVAAGWSGGSTASSEGARASYAVETGGNKLILYLYEYGGMTWSYYLYWWSHEPEFSLYGDGRVIVSCSPDVSKPPVLPCVNETHVSPDEIQRIIAAADKAGLLADGTYDADSVTDQTTTVFETTVGGYQHKVQAYALEKSASRKDESTEAARQQLMDYLASLERLGDFLGHSVEMKAYTATAMTVRIHSAEASAAERPAAIRTWPLSVDPAASVSSGLTLAGDDMAAFVVAAEGATVADVWMAPSGYYQVSAHPKYPDQ